MKKYDCLIMGAGFAGNCLARHLKLNAPHLSVALVDPRRTQRGDRDLKVGESTVEIASLHITKELGLTEYMIERQNPKSGLHFHWAKEAGHTETMDDYFSAWETSTGLVPTYNMNRARFETDLLAMNVDAGVEFYNGHVVDFEIREGEAPHRVVVKENGARLELEADHLVDAAGQHFLIGRKVDNLVRGQDDLEDISNASAWVRVRGVDRTIFQDGPTPERSVVSPYYATNHFLGHGHWLWMIPSARETDEVSIGVVFHKDKIPLEDLAHREQFLAFLKANHQILYRMVCSGEIVDFKTTRQIAFKSKRILSPDGWYVVGDAAFNFDAFYSMGTSLASFTIETVSQTIRDKVAGVPETDAVCEKYNQLNLAVADLTNSLLSQHSDQLGHPSPMSWRIYLDITWWVGFLLPLYLGKYHLRRESLDMIIQMTRDGRKGFFPEALRCLGEVAAQGRNIGMLNYDRSDTLGLGHHAEFDVDNVFTNTKFAEGRLNLFRFMCQANFYSILWYLKLNWRAWGVSGVLRPRVLGMVASMLFQTSGLKILDVLHRLRTMKLPNNLEEQQRKEEFARYTPSAGLVSWQTQTAETPSQVTATD